SPGSRTWNRPALHACTRSASVSMPTISAPVLHRDAARQEPTYPKPTMHTLASCRSDGEDIRPPCQACLGREAPWRLIPPAKAVRPRGWGGSVRRGSPPFAHQPFDGVRAELVPLITVDGENVLVPMLSGEILVTRQYPFLLGYLEVSADGREARFRGTEIYLPDVPHGERVVNQQQ